MIPTGFQDCQACGDERAIRVPPYKDQSKCPACGTVHYIDVAVLDAETITPVVWTLEACEGCGDEFDRDDMNSDTEHFWCDDCYEEVMAEGAYAAGVPLSEGEKRAIRRSNEKHRARKAG